MLNKNKIHSLVNSGNFNALKVAKGTGIIYSSFQSKLKSGSWSPDDVEVIADFFKKPLSYFFDREEPGATELSIKRVDCAECIEKQKRLDKAEKERDDYRQKYIECLEDLAGKKKAVS